MDDKPSTPNETGKPVKALPAHGSRLYTTEELSQYLGNVSVRTLEDWRRLNLGPDFVVLSPQLVRYRPAAVDRWLDSRERQSSVEALA